MKALLVPNYYCVINSLLSSQSAFGFFEYETGISKIVTVQSIVNFALDY